MKAEITTITCFYNEEYLIPFYMNHYWWADNIIAIVSESEDRTRALLEADHRVKIEDFKFPEGRFDDGLKRDAINYQVAHSAYDWAIICDSDEFVWFGGRPYDDARKVILEVPPRDTYLIARFWDVFRTAGDADLDPLNVPIIHQRRHGFRKHLKPCVVRGRSGIQLDVGAHNLLPVGNRVRSEFDCDGAHWQNADPVFAVNRRVRDRGARLSQTNISSGWGFEHLNIGERAVLDYCKEHSNDPKCF